MKTAVIDTETNALHDYDKLHVAVCRDLDTDEIKVFRNVHTDPLPFRHYLETVDRVIGHNICGFDREVILKFTGFDIRTIDVVDTLVVSRLLNYSQEGGHSLETWGDYFKFPKSKFSDFSAWSQELEDRCIVDVALTVRLFRYLQDYIDAPKWKPAIDLETQMVYFCQDMSKSGFSFDYDQAQELHAKLKPEVESLVENLKTAFPPRSKVIREIYPVLTKSGTLHSKDFRWLPEKDLTAFDAGSPFSLFEWEVFNPNSSKQRVERLNEAGWKPFNKTKGHIEAERNKEWEKLPYFKVYGWKVDEENLATLPEGAPAAAHTLARYLLLSSRLSDLEEWLALYNHSTGRIHGTFNGMGSWTHRMSHQSPNMANIPSILNKQGKPQPYGPEFRSLYRATPGRILVGCDAEGIQLRLFAHYCNDPKLIEAIVSGKKEDKTDIHSLNKAILGTICNSRDSAKTYIYALLLGAGKDKQANILQCKPSEAIEGLKRILEFYPGWKELKETRLKQDARKGYFIGLDGRLVLFPSAHYILAGYLQNGEAVVMKRASLFWSSKLKAMGIPFTPVNFVHDEWQVETDPEYADIVGQTMADSLFTIGQELGMNCPLAGKYVTGLNWKDTH